MQKINYPIGVPKRMEVVLQERGIDTSNMNGEKMQDVLASHPDFQNEKSQIERFLVEEQCAGCG